MSARIAWLGAVAAAVMVVAGCSSSKQAQGPSSSPSGLKVAMVTDAGGIDDRSFNASCWEGLKRAKAELGIETRYLESKEQSDYKTNLASLADQGNSLVVAVGYLMEDALKEVAPKYPDTKFVIIDGSAPALDNCAAIKFREEEGCFLVGYLAASVSKTGALGFVGGREDPLIKKFEVGYRAGARTARPDSRVIVKYVGDWTDVAKGKELARTAIEQGADIVMQAAGKAGLGVLDAAAEAGPGHFGIGVDKDQDDEHPGRVLTSMMKSIDTAVFGVVKDLKAGAWKPGDRTLGVREGGVGLSPMRHTRKEAPEAVYKRLEALKKAISDGTIKVPKTEDEMQNFVPPKP